MHGDARRGVDAVVGHRAADHRRSDGVSREASLCIDAGDGGIAAAPLQVVGVGGRVVPCIFGRTGPV